SRLAQISSRPEGIVQLNGTAKLDSNNNYEVTGNIQASNVSFVQDGRRIAKINLYSAIDLDPHTLDLKGMRLSALGGEIAGNANLEDFARYRVDATLHGFDIRSALRA